MFLSSFFGVLLLFHVSMQQAAPRIEQHPASMIVVNISDPVTLECRASGEPKPLIRWFKDGNLLNTIANKYTLIHDSDLFIISAVVGRGNKSDSGVYHCRAHNEFGEALSRNASLLITFLKDDFRESPKSRQVNSGSSVSMECKAPRGSPEPLIWWEKNGLPLLLQPHHHHVHHSKLASHDSFDNGTLLIRNASLVDNGEYKCVAQNEAGVRRSAPAYLNVFEKPSFLIKPETAKYEAGANLELECQANGFPKPLIEWKKDNSLDNIPVKAQIRDNTLVIPDVQLEDEGEYTCVASNQLASIETKSFLIVYEKPAFTKKMLNLTIGIESKSITIECNAQGKPQPIIYWAKSGQLPSAGKPAAASTGQDDFIILENGNLYIERLSKKYEGTYLCQASNEYGSIETKTNLIVKSVQSKPPPIIVYGPQNQTIPINTQATLECLTTVTSNVLFNSDLSRNAMTGQQLQNLYLSSEKIEITWYKTDQLLSTQYDSKFKLLDTGSLEINSVQMTDSGTYYCTATNLFGQTSSIPAFLNVENPNNQYVEFQRNYETTALPSAPAQPVIIQTGTNSVSLAWQPSSHSGHSPLSSYTIEYFSPEWPKTLPGWLVAVESISATQNSFTVENLASDTYYMFMIRARNNQGYGPPSQVSDLTKTLFEPLVFSQHNKNSNELLEKALTGEVVLLNEPAQVLSSTAFNISWKVLKSAGLIEGFYIKYKPIGAKTYQTETVSDKHITAFVLKNLSKFTPYEILIEPFSGTITGSESNVLQAKTLEDIPSQSPINLSVELDSPKSMSIKWQPPPISHMNGVVLGYKLLCVANETKFNLNLNTNATTRAIIVGNLVKDMRYCVKVAAFTKKGTGPYTTLKCIEVMGPPIAAIPTDTAEQGINGKKNMQSFLFIVLALVVAVLLVCCSVFVYLRCRHKWFKEKKLKFLSTSSENGSLNVPHKVDGGNRYKLVNDTIWLDTLHSGSNHSNQECCCVPDLHHQIFVQQNPANGNIHPSVDKKTKFLQDNNNGGQPQYAEIYGPSIQQLQQQLESVANPYATTGLFINSNMTDSAQTHVETNNNSTNNPYNMINYQSVHRNNSLVDANGNIKYSAYAIKMLAEQLQQGDVPLVSMNTGAATLTDHKKLIKYLQSTQSQTNTPRVLAKNLQNRVKSENHTNNNCCSTHHHSEHTAQQFVNGRYMSGPHQQMISYLAEQTNQDSLTNEAIQNFLDMIPTNTNQQCLNNLLQQQPPQQMPNSSSTPIPSLPTAPPPSLASALLAQQQQQHQSHLTQQQQKQLIDGYNNFLNTISRSQQSPVHYNMPWNGTTGSQALDKGISAFSSTVNNRLINQNSGGGGCGSQSNSCSFISNLTGQSTLSRGALLNHQISSTFTAQQYANRSLNNSKQHQHTQPLQLQQDYSSISPEDDLTEAELEELNYQTCQKNPVRATANRNAPMNVANMAHSWASVADTGSNPISSSYESPTNQNNLSTSSNSSDLSSMKRSASRSQDEMNNVIAQQQYDLQMPVTTVFSEDKKRFQPILKASEINSNNKTYLINSNNSNELYLSEMPQTIL